MIWVLPPLITTEAINKPLLVLFFLICTSLFGQNNTDTQWKNQVNPIFQGLDKNRISYGILLDFGMEFTNVPAYNGILTDSTYIDANIMGNIYKTLLMSKVTSNTQFFPKFEDYAIEWVNKRASYNQTTKGTLVIAGLYYKYSKINPSALSNGKITVSNNKYYDRFVNGVWQNPYLQKETIAFALPINNYNGRVFSVVLPSSLFNSNILSTIQNIKINFNDGGGYKNLPFNQIVNANYQQNGTYVVTFKTTLTNGSILYTRSKIKIEQTYTSKEWSKRNQ